MKREENSSEKATGTDRFPRHPCFYLKISTIDQRSWHLFHPEFLRIKFHPRCFSTCKFLKLLEKTSNKIEMLMIWEMKKFPFTSLELRNGITPNVTLWIPEKISLYFVPLTLSTEEKRGERLTKLQMNQRLSRWMHFRCSGVWYTVKGNFIQCPDQVRSRVAQVCCSQVKWILAESCISKSLENDGRQEWLVDPVWWKHIHSINVSSYQWSWSNFPPE